MHPEKHADMSPCLLKQAAHGQAQDFLARGRARRRRDQRRHAPRGLRLYLGLQPSIHALRHAQAVVLQRGQRIVLRAQKSIRD